MPKEHYDLSLTRRFEERQRLKRILFMFFCLWAIFFAYVFFSIEAKSQNKFFATPNRGVDGARGNAQIKALNDSTSQNRQDIQALQNTIDTSLTTVINDVGTLQAAVDASLTAVSYCGNLGMLGGPEHANADTQGCLPSLQVGQSGDVFAPKGIILGDNPTCEAATEGMLRYISAQKSVMLCTGTTWIEVGAAPAASGVFTPVTNANLGQVYTSNSVTLSGFFGTRTATATNGAMILLNGVSQGTSANVEAGDSVALRMTSSATFNTAKSTTLNVSSYYQTWTITTKEQDITPNSFSFSNLTNQSLSTQVTSSSVTPNGFDGPLTVSVSGSGSPELQVAGGPWATSASMNPGQSLRLRLTTSANFVTAHTATVTLGTFNTAWSATTQGGTCNLPWGGTINHGQSVTAYQSSSVPCGSSCASQTRTCSGGTLSGSYTQSSCSPESCVIVCHDNYGPILPGASYSYPSTKNCSGQNVPFKRAYFGINNGDGYYYYGPNCTGTKTTHVGSGVTVNSRSGTVPDRSSGPSMMITTCRNYSGGSTGPSRTYNQQGWTYVRVTYGNY